MWFKLATISLNKFDHPTLEEMVQEVKSLLLRGYGEDHEQEADDLAKELVLEAPLQLIKDWASLESVNEVAQLINMIDRLYLMGENDRAFELIQEEGYLSFDELKEVFRMRKIGAKAGKLVLDLIDRGYLLKIDD